MQKCLNMIVISNFCPFGGAGNYFGNNEKKISFPADVQTHVRFLWRKILNSYISCSILKGTKNVEKSIKMAIESKKIIKKKHFNKIK